MKYLHNRGQTRNITFAAILAALSLIILYGSTTVPTGRMGIVAAAGLVPAAAVVSGGISAGILCYVGTGLLALILLPVKDSAILYLLFFGLYPIVKWAIEQLRKLFFELLFKLLFFNVMLSVFLFGFRSIFLSALPVMDWTLWGIYLGGTIIFLIYDFGFSKVIEFYVKRIDKLLRFGQNR